MLIGCSAFLLLTAACLVKRLPRRQVRNICKDFEASMGYCVKEGDVYSNCYDDAALRRLVAAAVEFSKCNYWLASALQHVDCPDDFLSDPSSHYHSHIHCARCPKH